MTLNSLFEATKFVTDELQNREYEIRSGVWVNEHRNAIYTTINKLGYDETFFLKYDRAPFLTAGTEFNFPNNEKIGVCINNDIYTDYIVPCQAEILYALPDGVYHINYVVFSELAIGPHPQKANGEIVMALPFSKLSLWK